MANSHERKKSVEERNSMIDTSDTSEDVNSFFHFDIKAGRMSDLVFNNRAILTNEELWGTIQESLFSILKSNAAVILYQMGLEYGIAVGSRARESRQDIHAAVKFLEIYGFLAGWGKFSTSPISLSMGQLSQDVTVTVDNNFFAMSKHRKTEGPRCFMIAGLLAGITEGLLGEGYNCVETMCMAAGAKQCEFLITRRK
jgi:predicted hydrocarbon binding protein